MDDVAQRLAQRFGRVVFDRELGGRADGRQGVSQPVRNGHGDLADRRIRFRRDQKLLLFANDPIRAPCDPEDGKEKK